MKTNTILTYTILNKIGEGGMGSVYLAKHNTLYRKAAIIKTKSEADSFEREISLILQDIGEMNKNLELKNQIYDSVKRIIKAKICLGLIT